MVRHELGDTVLSGGCGGWHSSDRPKMLHEKLVLGEDRSGELHLGVRALVGQRLQVFWLG